MSWGAPAAGQYPPYQATPPTFNPQQPPLYGQQPPYGQQASYGQYPTSATQPVAGPPRPPENRPKKKGNPVITKFPPRPRGYRPPHQPPAPYSQNPYQPPQPSYPGYPQQAAWPNPHYGAPQAPPTGQTYPPSGYPPQPAYPPQPPYPQYPQPQPYQYPQTNAPPATGYPQPQNYPAPQPFPAQPVAYNSYPPQPAPPHVPQPPYPQPQSWAQPGNQPPHVPGDAHYSTSSAPTAAYPATSTAPSYPASGQGVSPTSGVATSNEKCEKPNLAGEEWDFDFDGPIWPKSNEPVDQRLSIGVITWHPAKQVTRALPATFQEAEEQALKPPQEKFGNAESVSKYFTLENTHEAFLDVRQTDAWEEIKDDPAFVVFPDEQDTVYVSLEECIASRDRPDEPLEEPKQVDSEEKVREASWSVMDNLEQALAEEAQPTLSTAGKDAQRGETDEDILARLGVTGSPKPPSNEVMTIPFSAIEVKPPASLPPKPPVRPDAGSHHAPPPPPPPPPEYDPWNSRNEQRYINGHSRNGIGRSPAPSESSNHTVFPGSDIDGEPDADRPNGSGDVVSATTKEPATKSLLGKRNFEETAPTPDTTRLPDGTSKRKRLSETGSAYSRR
ncbi:hypothetical protein M011DRAFT_480021 [Sporormia fimetaria CBS 119925]|uniref:Uncharacterized protein n=1 Tax=Sporormia fimetaria CBS 119925 TaxID=1340428 RepID=A0A6A6V164_9PLEO|nr:hypothetical protein M011DRAFT_480021 [Sporormia fimetaria CBS 119925]